MATFTIQDLHDFERQSFASLSEFLSYLEEVGQFVLLHELPDDEDSEELRKKAEESRKRFRKNPDLFHSL